MPSHESFAVTPGVIGVLRSADQLAKADGRMVITQADLSATMTAGPKKEELQGTAVVLYELMQVKTAIKSSIPFSVESTAPVEPLPAPASLAGEK